MMYPLAYDSWGNEEKQALQQVIDSGRYTMGNEVAEFEKQFATYCNRKYGVTCSNGTTALYLAVNHIFGLTSIK